LPIVIDSVVKPAFFHGAPSRLTRLLGWFYLIINCTIGSNSSNAMEETAADQYQGTRLYIEVTY
jgi:hypothetical protein